MSEINETVQPVAVEIDPRFTSIDTSYRETGAVPTRKAGVKSRPVPGPYYLRAGLVEVSLAPERSGVSARTGQPYTFPARVEVKPHFTIVTSADDDTTFANTPLNKYYRLTTEPVKRGRAVQNYSTLSSAFDAFGVEFPTETTAATIMAAAEALSGLTSLRPVYVTLAGTYRYRPFVMMPSGEYLRFTEKVFRTGLNAEGDAVDKDEKLREYKAQGGTWAPCGYLLDPEDESSRAWTLVMPSENAAHVRIWANLEPSEDGFLD